MAKQKGSGFQSAAGLVRYFDEEKTGFKIDPRLVIAMSVGTVIVITALHIYG
ncbi:MAG: preprotein translocase subunit Sec61beta [Candidatus Thermoplasmatota archaeon]|nr:preprotein translocase subunit Sec61beta [Candidatus Thermoplasmatota archaeon]